MPKKSETETFFDGRTGRFSDKSARWLFEDGDYVRGLIEMVAGELAEFNRL